MMRKATSVLCMLGLAAGLVVGGAGGASAYPPGTALTVTASPNPVPVNKIVTATARHVKPGCTVTFVLGSKTASALGGSTGVASAKLATPTTPGPRTMSATTSGAGCTVEKAYTRVVVTGPVVRCPTTVAHNKVFACTGTRFPAGTRLVLRFTKGSIVVYQHRTTNSSGSATMYFKLSRPGTYLVTASSGKVYASTTVKIT